MNLVLSGHKSLTTKKEGKPICQFIVTFFEDGSDEPWHESRGWLYTSDRAVMPPQGPFRIRTNWYTDEVIDTIREHLGNDARAQEFISHGALESPEVRERLEGRASDGPSVTRPNG